ncbi:Crp/Fnr family transcriptional regulator [Deminuibacter soli]|uniref:Crp/Fnr family transcriptional regulator n=1 Tax=Deminuibacter soli TaxID=2291815 RepID=A0A3E1NEB6_9BACT|nr:Crp/Fnr family transcriptional regulator [Deminuibacter soli]RFM26310.1 Crp/Fnr family transcriptional regulator [Deminuibacter soli]
MIPAAYTDFYRRVVGKFVSLTDEEWAVFTGFLTLKELGKKELFTAEGKVCTEVAFIVSGSFRLYFIKDGIEYSNYFCFEGDLISSFKSYLTQTPGHFTIDAMEPSVLLCYTYQGMQQMLAHPLIGYKMERYGRLVSEYLNCCYEDRLEGFVTQTPEERYCSLLQSGYDIMQRIPQHYVANFLGITPVSLSRIRKRLMESRSAL